MPNGKPGDHPLTDIVVHGWRVYSERADALVREIDALGGGDELAPLLLTEYNQFDNPDVRRLERVLGEMRDRLRGAKEARGREPGPGSGER
ncbi:MAG TPA: hypothetical protein VF746_06060 [Longimicrobium sp.]|jgi:hypothetical protein